MQSTFQWDLKNIFVIILIILKENTISWILQLCKLCIFLKAGKQIEYYKLKHSKIVILCTFNPAIHDILKLRIFRLHLIFFFSNTVFQIYSDKTNVQWCSFMSFKVLNFNYMHLKWMLQFILWIKKKWINVCFGTKSGDRSLVKIFTTLWSKKICN